jgi:hypothetical protein
MKLLAAGAIVVALGVLTAGCSGGSGATVAASSTGGATSAAVTAALPASGVATSAAAGAVPASSSGTPAGSPTTSAPSAAASQGLNSAATTTTPAVDGSASAASSGTTTAATGGKAVPVAVCTTLPTAQVASLSGTAVTTSREQDFAADNDYTCAYNTASGVGGLSVTVAVVGGALAYASSLSTDTVAGSVEHVTPVAGIGDKAFSARDGLRVLFGDRMIYVAGLTSVPSAEAIIKALEAKLQ